MISRMTLGIYGLHQYVIQPRPTTDNLRGKLQGPIWSMDASSTVPRLICLCFLLKSPFLLHSIASSHPNAFFIPVSTINAIALHLLIHLSACQTVSFLREETTSSLPVCTQLKHRAWQTGDAPFALFSLGRPGLKDCPRVIMNVPSHCPKCPGVYDKS